MSTISLTGNTLSSRLGVGSYMGMGNSFSGARSSTKNLTKELGSLKYKIDAVNTSVNVDGSQAKAAETREESKSSALTCGYDKLDTLISDVGTVDNKSATEVEKLKKDFYKRYDYLKPDSEKSWWDRVKEGAGKLWDKICDIGSKIADFVGDVVKWIGDHLELVLKAIAVVAMLVISIVALCTGVGAILTAVCWGCIIGILTGAVTGGLDSMQNGGSFWEGAINGAFTGGIEGAISGAIFGGIGALGGAFGSSFGNSYKLFRTIQVVSKASGVISFGMGAFDITAKSISYFDPDNPIVKLNNDLHSNKAYNYLQVGVETLAAFSGGAYSKAEITDGSHMYMNKNGEWVTHSHVKYATGIDGTNYHFVTGRKGEHGEGLIIKGYAEKIDMKDPDRPRLKHEQNTSGKLAHDDAGHVFGDKFNGPSGYDGVTSQSKYLNRSVKGEYNYRSMELDWVKAIKNNGQVTDVNIKINYGFRGVRPKSYDVKYKINGESFHRYFKNN